MSLNYNKELLEKISLAAKNNVDTTEKELMVAYDFCARGIKRLKKDILGNDSFKKKFAAFAIVNITSYIHNKMIEEIAEDFMNTKLNITKE